MTGKAGEEGAIVIRAIPEINRALPPVCDMAIEAQAIMFYMMKDGMNFVGAAKT
ncbi:MAG: hypothetical protein L3J18_02465 [Candidatus Brocadia sp.]|jgi:hypothetical protein|uniref:Uncharacterized protein n=1 Tax=Candidatus Brocadia fulgida TaxID=380242 RepID=A0A0M2UXJ8_9BACT|nr:MAG: hypothetical protein BROFUL_00464 [Candidatus Brocadia fulgida]MBV6519870.1 hypothetical protein [Candidatus Brocadia fulgida]MCC6325993.1 hypothetical protein [Candidatus Brocadia sp.]UJS21196.1 MAG: hypothetical protein L3J18_02465 [Candidatus Brocadia sp.]